MSNIYKNCKKITNTNSRIYKEYLNTVRFRFYILQMVILSITFILLLSSSNGMDIIPIWRQVYDIVALVLLSSILIYYIYSKYKQNDFFIADEPNWQKMQLNSDLTENLTFYEQVSNQLNQNKDAVRKFLKTFKNFFVIFIIGLFEDNIKSFLVTVFQLANISNLARFISLIVLLLLGFLPYSSIFYSIFLVFNRPYNKLKQFLETCIDHGLFVKNYTLLYCTKKILEVNRKNRMGKIES